MARAAAMASKQGFFAGFSPRRMSRSVVLRNSTFRIDSRFSPSGSFQSSVSLRSARHPKFTPPRGATLSLSNCRAYLPEIGQPIVTGGDVTIDAIECTEYPIRPLPCQ